MTEVILQGYQDDIDWAKKFKGAQVLMMSNNSNPVQTSHLFLPKF